MSFITDNEILSRLPLNETQRKHLLEFLRQDQEARDSALAAKGRRELDEKTEEVPIALRNEHSAPLTAMDQSFSASPLDC